MVCAWKPCTKREVVGQGMGPQGGAFMGAGGSLPCAQSLMPFAPNAS